MSELLTDTHVHLWDPRRARYDWLREVPALDAPHDMAAFRHAHDGVDVSRVVFVECTVAFDDEVACDEVMWVQRLAQRDSRLAGIVAHASLERGAAVAGHLRWLAARPLVKGVRRLLQDEPDGFCLQPAFVEGVRLLAEFGLSFDACVYHHQLPQVIALVDHCPEVHFVLDHLGKPAAEEESMEPWRTHLTALAERPHVACKVSGLLTEAGAGWTPDRVRPYLEVAVEAFGFDRLLFGSDWPVLTLAGTYPQWVALVREAVAGCSEAERAALFHDNATRVYRLDAS